MSFGFNKITLNILQTDLYVVLFEDGKTHYSQINKKQHYIKEINIYFDIDIDQPNAQSMAQLIESAKYFAKTFDELELVGYTDNTGSVQHNDDLAARRVASVRKILIQNGVDSTTIRIGSYGKHRSVRNSKEARALERKVSIRYDMYMLKQQMPIVYQIVARDKEYPTLLFINIKGFSVEGCQMPAEQKHKSALLIKCPEDSEAKEYQCEVSDGVITLDTYSGTHEMPYYNFLNILYGGGGAAILADHTILDKINVCKIGLHTCSYYSSKESPTLALMVFPDVNLIYNFRYDFQDDYFFKDIKVPLIKGTPMVHEWRKIFDDIMKPYYGITDSIAIGEDGEEKSLKTILDEAWYKILQRIDIFQTGVHAAYNFVDDKPLNIKDYSQENYITSKISHIYYADFQFIIDLLIQFLLRGKGKGKGKTTQTGKDTEGKKRSKFRSFIKDLEENPMDYIVTPKIAESSAIYYEQKPEGVSRMYRQNVCDKPLLGIKYTKTVDLLQDADSILKSNSLISWFNSNQNKIEKAEFTISVDADMNLHYDFTLDRLSKNIIVGGLKEE